MAATTTLTPSPTVIASRPTICVSKASSSSLASPAAQKTYITPKSFIATSPSNSNNFHRSSFFSSAAGKAENYPDPATGQKACSRRTANTATSITSSQQQYRKEYHRNKEHSKHDFRGTTDSSTSAGFGSEPDSSSLGIKNKGHKASPLNPSSPPNARNTSNFRKHSCISLHGRRDDKPTSAFRTAHREKRDDCKDALSPVTAPRQTLDYQNPRSRDAVFSVPSQLHQEYQSSSIQSRSIITATIGADAAPVLANVKTAMALEDGKAQAEDENEKESDRLENSEANVIDKPDEAQRAKVNDHEDSLQKETEKREGRRTTAPLEKQPRTTDPTPKVMPIKYEICDVHDLGFLIADMLMELVRLNDGIPLKDGQLTRFHSRAPPSISFRDYLIRLIVHATLSPPLLLSMVFYIDRLCALYPAFTISSLTVHRFLITAATVAAKGLGDSFWTNSTYARVGGVSVKELALLELELLKRLEWRIVPKPEVLVDYYKSLVERSSGYLLEKTTEAVLDADQI